MYGGIRAKNMSLMHVSDVHFLLEEFVQKVTNFVIDTSDTKAATLVVEDVVARSRLELVLILVAMYKDRRPPQRDCRWSARAVFLQPSFIRSSASAHRRECADARLHVCGICRRFFACSKFTR
jgi:hypothetical protein